MFCAKWEPDTTPDFSACHQGGFQTHHTVRASVVFRCRKQRKVGAGDREEPVGLNFPMQKKKW